MDWIEGLSNMNMKRIKWSEVDRVIDDSFPHTRHGMDAQACKKALLIFWRRAWHAVEGDGYYYDAYVQDPESYAMCMQFLQGIIKGSVDLNDAFQATYTFFQLCELAIVEMAPKDMDRELQKDGPATRVVRALLQSRKYTQQMQAYLKTRDDATAFLNLENISNEAKVCHVCCCCEKCCNNGSARVYSEHYYQGVPTLALHMYRGRVMAGSEFLT